MCNSDKEILVSKENRMKQMTQWAVSYFIIQLAPLAWMNNGYGRAFNKRGRKEKCIENFVCTYEFLHLFVRKNVETGLLILSSPGPRLLHN
jgi:hypothetical protein